MTYQMTWVLPATDTVEMDFLDIEVPIKREELMLLCIDVSPSMSGASMGGGTKAEQVYLHIVSEENGLLQRLHKSANRQAYFVGAVLFNESTESVGIAKLVDDDEGGLMAPPQSAFNPRGDGTAIGDALTMAGEMASAWIAEGTMERIATIVLLTDGQNTTGRQDPLSAASAIRSATKRNDNLGRDAVTIATVAYGQQADTNLLLHLASTNYNTNTPFFEVVESGAALRDFLIRTITHTKTL